MNQDGAMMSIQLFVGQFFLWFFQEVGLKISRRDLGDIVTVIDSDAMMVVV